MLIRMHNADSLVIDFPITFPTTGPVTELSADAVHVVSAYRLPSGPNVLATTSAEGNTVTAVFDPRALDAAAYRLQLKLSIDGQVQTLVDQNFSVLVSN